MKLENFGISYKSNRKDEIRKGAYLGFTNDKGEDELIEEGPFSIWQIKKFQDKLPKTVRFFKLPIREYEKIHKFETTGQYT